MDVELHESSTSIISIWIELGTQHQYKAEHQSCFNYKSFMKYTTNGILQNLFL